MGTSTATEGTLSEGERRQLISELFHALSQPLTALRCSLEMALNGRFAPGPSEANLRLALDQSEQIAQLATGMRELLEADAPGRPGTVVNLESCLGEAVVDLAPVAESSGIELRYASQGICAVLAEPRRLRQALFYLVEAALSAAHPGEKVHVEAGQRDHHAIALLTISRGRSSTVPQAVMAWPGTAAEQKHRDLGRRLGLAIARRTFEAAGGRLDCEEGQNHLRLCLVLPLAAAAS